MAPQVDIGYFENFKGCNTLLLVCEQLALPLLREAFDQLASGQSKSVALHTLPFVRAHNVTLFAATTVVDQGLRRAESSFSWQRSATGWSDVLARVVELQGPHPSHAFLDGPNDEITLLLSVGEYDSSLWHRDGSQETPPK